MVCLSWCIFTQPLRHWQDATKGHFVSGGQFIFSYTGCSVKGKELSLSYYLSIHGRWRDISMLFPRAFAWGETQAASFRIWYQVNESISYRANRWIDFVLFSFCLLELQIMNWTYELLFLSKWLTVRIKSINTYACTKHISLQCSAPPQISVCL